MTTRPNMEQLEQEALELYSGLVRQDAAARARLRDLRDLQDEVQEALVFFPAGIAAVHGDQGAGVVVGERGVRIGVLKAVVAEVRLFGFARLARTA
ncbi:hypothetical protein MK163_19540 [bacterium]|nr:hypothetical protein [bacterium]